jgi:hypothetical protein
MIVPTPVFGADGYPCKKVPRSTNPKYDGRRNHPGNVGKVMTKITSAAPQGLPAAIAQCPHAERVGAIVNGLREFAADKLHVPVQKIMIEIKIADAMDTASPMAKTPSPQRPAKTVVFASGHAPRTPGSTNDDPIAPRPHA